MQESQQTEPKARTRGRPKGSYKYDEPTTPKTHRLTPTGHNWIQYNKEWIENKARQ